MGRFRRINPRNILTPLLTLLTVVLFPGCSNGQNWIDTLPKPWTLNPEGVNEILPEFHRRYPDFHERLRAFSLWQVGKPYELFCLGEESGEDKDPIIRLDKSDCTVHVLTSLSFAQARSWDEAKEKIITIHYKDGIPSFQSRWHYTTDRLQENSSTRDMTTELLPPENLEFLELTLNQKEDGSSFLDLDWKKPTSLYYIPNDQINSSLLEKIPEVCGVAFVKKSYFKLGLVIAHEGMLIDQSNLIHASSEFGETVNVNFLDFYFRDDGPIFDGIMIYEFLPLSPKL